MVVVSNLLAPDEDMFLPNMTRRFIFTRTPPPTPPRQHTITVSYLNALPPFLLPITPVSLRASLSKMDLTSQTKGSASRECLRGRTNHPHNPHGEQIEVITNRSSVPIIMDAVHTSLVKPCHRFQSTTAAASNHGQAAIYYQFRTIKTRWAYK